MTWKRVKQLAHGRERTTGRARASRTAAIRDTAIVVCLGELGLRNEELRAARLEDLFAKRSDGTPPVAASPRQGRQAAGVPLATEAIDALTRWERHRPSELADDPLLFPRLGRQRVDGSFPDAGGQLTGNGLTAIVKPVMQAAGVPDALAHPHVLRYTFGTLWLARGGELSRPQTLMGHASPATTAAYVHHTDRELEHAVTAQVRGPSVLAAHAQR